MEWVHGETFLEPALKHASFLNHVLWLDDKMYRKEKVINFDTEKSTRKAHFSI